MQVLAPWPGGDDAHIGHAVTHRQEDLAAALLADVHANARVQVRSFEAVCRLIAAGQGVGVLPQGAVQIFRKEMALRFIEIDDPWADRQMYLCRRQEQPSLASRELFDYLAGCGQAAAAAG